MSMRNPLFAPRWARKNAFNAVKSSMAPPGVTIEYAGLKRANSASHTSIAAVSSPSQWLISAWASTTS